jgi:hypothetical protein
MIIAVTSEQIQRLAPWWFVMFGSLAVLGGAALLGGDVWIDRTAVIGTAIGTLALAIATQALATKTEQSVRHSAELAETGREQLRTATQELEAARNEAQSAARAARAAEHAQVDAMGPLLTASIVSGHVMIQRGVGPAAVSERVTASAPLTGDLTRQHVFMQCTLTLANVGRLPANVSTTHQTVALQGRIVRYQPPGSKLNPTIEEIIPLPWAQFVVGAHAHIPVRFSVSAPAHNLGGAVEVRFSFEVSGPLAAASDTLSIRASVTPLVDRGAGFTPHETPVQIIEHRLKRSYVENQEV